MRATRGPRDDPSEGTLMAADITRHTDPADGAAARWFAGFTVGIRNALPPWLQRLLPVTFIGYAIINGSSFLLDMGILALIGGWLPHVPYGITFSIGYGIASVYAFILNRWLNFREHGDLGKQSGKYTFVIISNYVIWILGFGSLLGYFQVPLMVARVTAACIEGLYIYLMLRLWVFPRAKADAEAGAQPGPAAP